MGGIYSRICELLNCHDVPDAPWKRVLAALAVAGCFITAAYQIYLIVF